MTKLEEVVRAMEKRAAEPFGTNLVNIQRTPVSSMGVAWLYIAQAALEALRVPNEAMVRNPGHDAAMWERMIDAILKEKL